MNFLTIIGLCGKAGSGKTTIANYLKDEYEFESIAFADALKRMIIKSGLLSVKEIEEKPPHARFILQRIGTDLIREQIDPDFWVKKALTQIGKLISKGIKRIVIEDVRFPNEASLVKLFNGKIIKVERNFGSLCNLSFDNSNSELNSEIKNHNSEILLNKIPADYVIQNAKSLSDLYLEVDALMLKMFNISKNEKNTFVYA